MGLKSECGLTYTLGSVCVDQPQLSKERGNELSFRATSLVTEYIVKWVSDLMHSGSMLVGIARKVW